MSSNRRGKGRKKIEIKPIVKASSRQVCFSKRRQGLFTKANELCILCGTELAILLFSPAGKPFSYAHPSMENVVGRFLNGGAAPSKPTPEDHSGEEINKSNLAYWMECLETEKRRRTQLQAAINDTWHIESKPFWWDPADVCSMAMPELLEYQKVLRQQQYDVAQAETLLCSPEPPAPAEIGKDEFADVRHILDCMSGDEFGEADFMSWLPPLDTMSTINDYVNGFGF